MTKIAVTTLLLLTSAAGSTHDYIAKTKRIDDYRIVITCENNADPTGIKLDHNTLMITCADERVK